MRATLAGLEDVIAPQVQCINGQLIPTTRFKRPCTWCSMAPSRRTEQWDAHRDQIEVFLHNGMALPLLVRYFESYEFHPTSVTPPQTNSVLRFLTCHSVEEYRIQLEEWGAWRPKDVDEVCALEEYRKVVENTKARLSTLFEGSHQDKLSAP